MISSVLPPEVLSYIVDAGSFSKQELCLVSLASAHLRHTAQKILFRDPGRHSITVGSNAADHLATARSFLRAIISSPDRLALTVRRYNLTLSWTDFTAPNKNDRLEECREAQQSIFDLLSRGLPLMANLAELQLYTDVKSSRGSVHRLPPSTTLILRQCTFQLKIFRCSYVETTPGDRNVMQDFLQIQSNIRELWVQVVGRSASIGSANILPEPQNICPCAESVGGEPAFITGALLAGRNLEHISWRGAWFERGDALLRTVNTDNVQLMECIDDHGPGLHVICTTFCNLVLLKTGSLGMNRVLQNPLVLSDLPRLRVLLVSLGCADIWSSNRSLLIVASPEESIRHFVSGSPSLQYIEAHDSEGGTKYIIDRDTRIITTYMVPIDAALCGVERKEELYQRIPVRRGLDDVFLKAFPLRMEA